MTSRPNVVLIVSDDHGYGDRSAVSVDPGVRTPHLDALAADGVSFTRGYVTAPICSPSRAGLISGRYQQRWGAGWFDTSAFPPPEVPSMAEVLRSAGYRCGYFGKVHYGPDEPGSRACPDQHGFGTTLYGLAAESMGRLHYLRHSKAAMEEYGDQHRVHGVAPLWTENGQQDVEEHLTVALTDRAIDFIDEDDDAPWLCMVAYNAVHNFAWQLPDDELDARGLPKHPDYDGANDYLDWYDGAISPGLDHGREFYLAQLEIMDTQIGRIRQALAASGQDRDTVIIYLTDNGGSTCNFGDNAPLRGTKYSLYEGGVRVPFLVHHPDGPAGVSTDALVSSLDLVPTLAALAGIEDPDAWDGQDLTPVLSAEADAAGHDRLHFDTEFQWAVVEPDWKLHWVEPDAKQLAAIESVEHTQLGRGLRLIDLANDPGETTDVSTTHPDQVARLLRERQTWCELVGRDPRIAASGISATPGSEANLRQL